MEPQKIQRIQAIDRVVHEPVRLAILTVLAGVQEADFAFLITALGASKGNLASHMAKLEEAGYVTVRKEFVGKIPRTSYRATAEGRAAYERYWQAMRTLQPTTEAVAAPPPPSPIVNPSVADAALPVPIRKRPMRRPEPTGKRSTRS